AGALPGQSCGVVSFSMSEWSGAAVSGPFRALGGFLSRSCLMRILIVEDEPKTGSYLKQGLTEAGYVVDWVCDGITGQHQAEADHYDLPILDAMLPGQDGWTLLRNLRRTRSTPVLFLTARDDVGDRVKGLELGADDYLAKPFDFVELSARIKSILR